MLVYVRRVDTIHGASKFIVGAWGRARCPKYDCPKKCFRLDPAPARYPYYMYMYHWKELAYWFNH